MKYTNNYNLPEPFVRAVVNDPYDKGNADFSATQLANPPRAIVLMERHKDEIEVDVSTRVAALIGQGTHSLLERAARLDVDPPLDIFEFRFYGHYTVGGKTYMVSSQIDLYERDTKTLYDWKTTKAYAFSKKAGSGKKPEWIEQLNIGAENMRQLNILVESLKIIALLKDFDPKEAGQHGMPPTEVMAVDLPLWTTEETIKHVTSKIEGILKARETLPSCSPKETWGGNKCARWCDVNSVCTQYQDSLKTGVLHKTNGE